MIKLPPMRISQGEPFAYQARVMGQSWVGYSGQAVFRLKRRARRTAFSWNGYGYLSQTDPIISVAVTGDATGLMSFSLTAEQTLLFPSLPRAGFFVTARGEITMGNGADQRKYQFDVAVAEALDPFTQPGGGGGGGGGVIVPPVVLPATNTVAPLLTGTGKIGAVHTVTTGTWANAVSYLYRWKRSGAVISGATLSTYTPIVADDSALLVGEVAGVNIEGTVSAYVASNSIAITYAAPFGVGTIPNVSWQQSVAITPLLTATYFTGANLTFGYLPAVPGISINAATGALTGTPTTISASVAITVTATNSGGSATRIFNATVVSISTPVLSGFTVSGGRFQYSSTTAGVAYWAVTDTSVSPLTGAALEAQATGYDKGTFGVGSSTETDDITLATTPIGVRRAHLVVKNAGAYSNVQTHDFTFAIGDSAAPVLSSPTATQTGANTATGTVSTTDGNGTLYRALTTSATPPSAAQIKLGQNNLGASAAFAGAQAVTASGAQNVTYTGLTASTVYYAYYMQEDAAGNQSNVSAAASITTAAGGGGNPEILLDAGFDDASKFLLNTGYTVSGSALNISGAGAFSTSFYSYANVGLVTAGLPLTLLIDVQSSNGFAFKVSFEEYTSADVYVRTETPFQDLTMTAGIKSVSYTPGATCAKVQAIFSAIDAELVTVIRSISLKVT